MFIYFLYAPSVKAVKIGSTFNLRSRFSMIQSSCPLPLYYIRIDEILPPNDALKIESELHERFAGYRLQGEWFHLEGELFKFLAGDIVDRELDLKHSICLQPRTFNSDSPESPNINYDKLLEVDLSDAQCKVLKVEEVASKIGISESEFLKLARNTALPIIQLGAKTNRIPIVAFKSWLNKMSAR